MASKRPGSRSIDSYFQKTSTATSQTDGEDPKRKRLTESDVTSSDSVESVDPDKSLKHGSSARPAESNLVSTAAQVPFPEYVDIASTQFRNTDDEIKLSILCENSKHPNVWQKFTFPSHNIDGKQRKFVHTEEDSNFKAILERVAASNTVLLDHLKNASRNATYISPAIQNEIDLLVNVRNALVEECNAAQCFSLLADEATDSATIEQVSISVRYVHHKDTGDIQVKEEFLGFKEAPGRTTAAVMLISFKLPKRVQTKRQHQFQEKLKETPESQEQMGRRAKLRTLCETRWGARADALCTFKSSFDVILKALEVLDTIQDSKARGFINSMLKFEFIIALIASEWLLQFIVPLTNYLQTVDLDLLQAHAQANVVIQSLRNERKDESWNKLHEMAVSLAVKHDVAVCKPRLAGRQLFRENVPADSVSEYYKLAMYYPFLDHLISELDSRLIKPSPLFKVTNLLPKNVGNWSPAEISAKEILDAYDPDIPEDIQQLHESECLRWKLRWDKVDNPPATIVETLPHCRPQEFPNLSRAFTALLTLPITTATAERSFSALRRLKTYLRSTMKEDRLSGLALMHIHKHDVSLNAEDIVDDFAASGNRRIELLF
ncbi:hypothetical protein ACROYT_G014479 [Oculina patagonica]